MEVNYFSFAENTFNIIVNHLILNYKKNIFGLVTYKSDYDISVNCRVSINYLFYFSIGTKIAFTDFVLLMSLTYWRDIYNATILYILFCLNKFIHYVMFRIDFFFRSVYSNNYAMHTARVSNTRTAEMIIVGCESRVEL